MTFAALTADGWVLIIAAISLGLQKLWSMWLEYQREKDRVARDRQAAIKVAQVAEKVEVVHKATNSIKDELVRATDRAARSEGHAQGMRDQQALGDPHEANVPDPRRPGPPPAPPAPPDRRV